MKGKREEDINGEERTGGRRAAIELRERTDDAMIVHVLCDNCQRKSGKFQIRERSE